MTPTDHRYYCDGCGSEITEAQAEELRARARSVEAPAENRESLYVPEGGYYRAGAEPERYHWAVAKIQAAFPDLEIRIGYPTDYGRGWQMGLMIDPDCAFAFHLCRIDRGEPVVDENGKVSHWPDVAIDDVNEHPERVDQFIDRVRTELAK
jgi:hypothetical protein